MKTLIKSSIFATVLFASTKVLAVNTGPVEINSIGCHLNDGTCYVYITDSFGPESCHRNSIRWNKDTANSGKETLSMLLAAFAASKKVNFSVSDTTCYGSYPTFNFINVYK